MKMYDYFVKLEIVCRDDIGVTVHTGSKIVSLEEMLNSDNTDKLLDLIKHSIEEEYINPINVSVLDLSFLHSRKV